MKVKLLFGVGGFPVGFFCFFWVIYRSGFYSFLIPLPRGTSSSWLKFKFIKVLILNHSTTTIKLLHIFS